MDSILYSVLGEVIKEEPPKRKVGKRGTGGGVQKRCWGSGINGGGGSRSNA